MVQLVRIHLQCGRPGFDPWVGKIPWRRERLLDPVFWPGEFHGLCSPWSNKELDLTERLSLSVYSIYIAGLFVIKSDFCYFNLRLKCLQQLDVVSKIKLQSLQTKNAKTYKEKIFLKTWNHHNMKKYHLIAVKYK